MVDGASGFINYAIHCYAPVGADSGAGGTAYTGIRVGVGGEMISAVIDIFGLQREHVARARNDTEVATFASMVATLGEQN